MPATHFRCPDGEIIEMGECLRKCRMAERCLTKNTLIVLVSQQRTWTGVPSTTQLLKGTREAYLQIKKNYAISPRDQAYSLLGTNHHAVLAVPNTSTSINEEQLQGDQNISGIADLIEEDELHPGFHVITDYKTYGSYRVAKMLGLESYYENHPTEKYKRSGSWGHAGTPKRVKKFRPNPEKEDLLAETLQLNQYRRLAESKLGIQVSRLNLQITVRDGSLMQATSRGVTEKIYYPIEVPILDNNLIDSYFAKRRHALINHVEANVMPGECNEKETWDGRKCETYCEVASFCDVGQAALVRVALQEKRDKGEN